MWTACRRPYEGWATRTCYFLLNYVRVTLRPLARPGVRGLTLAIFFWIMFWPQRWRRASRASNQALLFSFELCGLINLPVIVPPIPLWLAIFFWIMYTGISWQNKDSPTRNNRTYFLLFSFELCTVACGCGAVFAVSVPCYFLLNYVPQFCWQLFYWFLVFYLLFSFELCHKRPPMATGMYMRLLLFSFELCNLLPFHWEKYVPLITCYFLLNYVQTCQMWSVSTCTVLRLAIFFWIMLLRDCSIH